MDEAIRKIGLGSVQFGIPYGISNSAGQTSPEEVSGIIQVAREWGVRTIDTASAYGNAERVLGQNDLSDFRIVSKFMPLEEGESVSVRLQKSLDDLGVTVLYGYLAHRPDHLKKNLYLWDEMRSLKEKGYIQKIGFSLNRTEELEDLLSSDIKPDLVQVPYNYFDRRFRGQMIDLKKEGCEIHSRSVFLQGLFFMDIDRLDNFFNEIFPVLEHLQKSVDDLPGALLNYVLHQPFIDTVVIGVENKNQFIQNLESIRKFEPLPELNKEISESIIIPSNWPTQT